LPDRSTWWVTLDPPAEAIAGRSIVLRAELVATDGTPTNPSIQWYVGNRAVQHDASDPLEYQLKVPKPATVKIRVQATANGESREARLTLHVVPARAWINMPRLQKYLETIASQQTWISGFLIAVIGFLLYRNIFIGDWGDFATAFFWGFSADIGIAKVRELATPLVSRSASPAVGNVGGR
jgi:hypothetical protein